MSNFNDTQGSGAIKHITGLNSLAVIDDNTDSMHTGIIQYLNAAAAGNYVVDGMMITQTDGGTHTTFTVSPGGYFRNHVMQNFTQASKTLESDAAPHTYYVFLVVDTSNTLQIRGSASDGQNETDVGNLANGDVPIALIEINKADANDSTTRKIQYYGATAKGRGFSVTGDDNNETLQLKTDGTILYNGGVHTLPGSTTTLVGRDTTDTLTNKTLNFAGGSGNTIQNIPNSALSGVNFTVSDGTNSSTVALGETITIQGTNNEVEVAENSKTFTIGLPSSITANLTGNADTATSATTAATATNVTVSTNDSTDETVFPLFVDAQTGSRPVETDVGLKYNPSTGKLISTTFEGNLTGNVTGNADTATSATQLANDRDFSITGDITASAISFNGTGDVALSATIDNNSVALGTKTTGSYVAQGATSGSGISGSVNSEGGTFTVTSNATSANTASTIVFRDSNGDFNAGTINATLSGNVTGNVTGTVSDISNHDTGDLVEGTNKYLTLANLKSQLNASMPSNALTIGDSNDTITIPGDLVVTGTTTTASVETVSTSNGVVFEGSIANNNETTLVGGNPLGDITITLPNTAGTVALTTSDISGNAATATKWASPRNITLTGDVTGVVSIDGSTNVSLATTIAGDSVALGTDTIGNYVASITSGDFLTGGNGGSEGAALTLAVDATNLNTASKVVARDSSGNFSAGTITATLSGNASTATQVANLNNHDTDNLSEGSNLYHTTERVQDVVGGQIFTNGSHTNITAAYDDNGDGAIDLSITDATIRGKISVTDSGGDGSLAYNNSTGVITYTGPSASEVRAHISAGTGVGISSGQISIGQAVATDSNVQFGTITGTTITGSSIVKSGGSSSEFLKADGSVDSSTYLTAHPNISGASTVSASTATFIDGLTFDSNGHVTATSTSTALIGVTDGNLIDTSTTNGNVTIAVDLSELADMTQSVDKTQDELVILDNGSQKRKLISEIPISALNNDGSALNPSNFSTITSFDASNDKFVISDASASNAGVRILASDIPLSAFDNTATGFTSNPGTVTSATITAGTGLSGGGTITSAGTLTLDLDFSELTDMTGDISGTTEFILQDGTTESRKAASEIKLSAFNNDLTIDNTTYSISAVDGDNADEEKIRLTGTDSSTDDVVLEAGTGLSIARSGDKITFTNTVSDTNTNQLTTFTLRGTTNTSPTTVNHNDTITIAAGTGITTTSTSDGVITVASTLTSNATHTGDVTGSTTLTIADDAVTYAKIQNVSATNRILGRDSAGAGVIEEITPANLRTMINVEDGADVTDTANVTAAGALMDSEVTNLAQVKAFDSSDYATAAQGTTADAALARSGGQMTGNITFSGTQTVDGRDLSVDGTKLDGIEANATADQTDSEIETAYNNQVSQVSSAERTSGTATGIRRYAPADIKSMIDTHQTDTNTNQLTTFNIGVDTNNNATTIAHGETLTFTGGTGISTETTADGTVTITNDSPHVATNLGSTTATGQITITSSTGNNVVIGEATSSIAGLMSTTHHDKLDGIEASADVTDTANVRTALNAAMPSNTLTIGDGSTAVTIPGNLTVTGDTTYSNETIQIVTDNTLAFRAGDGNSHEILLTADDATDDRTITLPNAAGTVAVSASGGIALSSAGDITANLSASHIPSLDASKIGTGTFPTARIADEAVTEAKLDINNTAQNGYLLAWHDSDQQFQWVNPTSAGSSNQTITTGNGLTGANSGSASNITIAVGAGTGIDVAADAISVDVSDFMTNGANNRILTATGTDAMNAEANLTFDGSTLAVTGALTATTKSFDIEHPTKEGMRLHHGSLEGPEHGVYIRGRLEGNEIDLPDYWLGLVDEDTITVQLTPNKGFQQIYVENISDNKVYVGTQSDKPIDCFYFIQAERKDIDRMEVEY